MSLQEERILLESKINGHKRNIELKKIEGEMFVEKARNLLSPYLDFDELEADKALLAVQNVSRLSAEIAHLKKEIADLERKL